MNYFTRLILGHTRPQDHFASLNGTVGRGAHFAFDPHLSYNLWEKRAWSLSRDKADDTRLKVLALGQTVLSEVRFWEIWKSTKRKVAD